MRWQMTTAKAVVFVTGAGSGLGKATAKYLAAQKARIIVADINESEVLKTVHEIHEIGGSKDYAIGSVIDICDEAQVRSALSSAREKWGFVNVAVNCAGIVGAPTKTLSKLGPHDLSLFTKILTVNTVGTFNIIRLVAEEMARNSADEDGIRGVIINTASIAAMDGQIGQVAYAASKGALVSMTLPLARDLASHGIRVCTICPGLFSTPLLEGLSEKVKGELASTVPLPKRLGKPTEFALLVESIISNPMLNGETIRLDGAIRMKP